MALRPCSFGNHRFIGRAGTVYPALLRDSDTLRWRFWTCPDHSRVVDEALTPHEISNDLSLVNPTPDADTCLTCGGPAQRDQCDLAYVTTYFQGQDRRDFAARIHRNCGRPGFLPE